MKYYLAKVTFRVPVGAGSSTEVMTASGMLMGWLIQLTERLGITVWHLDSWDPAQ